MSDTKIDHLTTQEHHILEHATGWKSKDPLYRNRYVAGPDVDVWPVLMRLCERGLLIERLKANPDMGGMSTFAVTEQGIAMLRSLDGAA